MSIISKKTWDLIPDDEKAKLNALFVSNEKMMQHAENNCLVVRNCLHDIFGIDKFKKP